MNTLRRFRPSHLGLLAALSVAGCAAPDAGLLPKPLFTPPELQGDGRAAGAEAMAQSERRMQVTTPPALPKPESLSTVKSSAVQGKGKEVADLSISFDQMTLPNFIQVVFGQVMKKNFSMDPGLVARTDLVTFRTGQPQTQTQLLETTRLLLKSYGVAVIDTGGEFYRIVPDTNQAGFLPEIRRGRAQPDVPLPLRPVFNLVELTAVRFSDVGNWLKAMFGNRLTIQEDPGRNALLISGPPAEITAALEAIQVLDQPLMRGRSSRLITPASLSPDDLARRLVEILGAEGYSVGMGTAQGMPIGLVPVAASGALLVFAADPAIVEHVVEWAQKLDSMDNTNRRAGGNYFSYEVKYADAQALAKTLQELMGTATTQVAPAGTVVVGTPRQPARIVVNAATNTLIVSTQNQEDYAQLLNLMRALDRPAKSAMIDVTVAEVRIGDKAALGLEWSTSPRELGNGTITGGTSGGVNLGTGGLSFSYLNNVGVVRARLNAFASDSRARILSAPRVMARNGESATIQVGQEVPIVTSQQSTQTAGSLGNANTAGVLQTIQYRNTGVILKVRPIIFAGRVELDVQQEVSTVATESTAVSITPTFTTRKIDTKVSIRDGATVALGGLISRNKGKTRTGVPFLKDIPGVGQLFRNDSDTFDETELIILITPYVVENDLVAEQVTQALRGQLGAWAQSPGDAGLQPKVVSRSDVVAPPATVDGGSAGSSPALPAPMVPTQPVPAPADPAPAAGAATAPGTPAVGARPAPTLTVPSGVKATPVTDPVLLEELRRASGAKGGVTGGAQVNNPGASQATPAAPSASRPSAGKPVSKPGSQQSS